MKKFILSLLALVAITITASAQYSSAVSETIMPGGTNNVAATATNDYSGFTTGFIIRCKLQSYAGIYVSAKASDASTGTLPLKFAKSYDGTNFETVPSVTVTLTLTGTNTAKAFSAPQVDGVHSLKLATVGNANAVDVTNLFIGHLNKR